MFGSKKREEKRNLKAAHTYAMEKAQATYDEHKHEDIVFTEGSGPGYTFVSAAGPEREAWDHYWDLMDQQGYNGHDTRKRFDKELKK